MARFSTYQFQSIFSPFSGSFCGPFYSFPTRASTVCQNENDRFMTRVPVPFKGERVNVNDNR